MIRFTAGNAYVPHPLWEVFDPVTWRADYGNGSFFKDKVVMVGSSAQIQHDVVDTPMNSETLGPALHLQALAAALDHEFLREMPLAVGFATIAIAGVVAWLLLFSSEAVSFLFALPVRNLFLFGGGQNFCDQ